MRDGDVVRFVPPVSQAELPLATAGATVGVIPYENVGMNHWFCTPNKLWEYPNAGVPVLVSPFPELRKPIEEYACGWLLSEDDDPSALSRQLDALSEEDIAAAKRGCVRFTDAEIGAHTSHRLVDLYSSLSAGRIGRIS